MRLFLHFKLFNNTMQRDGTLNTLSKFKLLGSVVEWTRESE